MKKIEENSKEKANSGSLREMLDTFVSFSDKRCKKLTIQHLLNKLCSYSVEQEQYSFSCYFNPKSYQLFVEIQDKATKKISRYME